MDERRPIPLPVARVATAAEEVSSDLAAAIALVAEGGATRVTVANIDITDELAGHGAALAQHAGVAFAIDRDPATGRRAIRIGPRLW